MLFASVIDGAKGEMYFYYYPKKIIKSKPINCYEIPDRFGLDETKYYSGLKRLYERIKELNTYFFPRWTNITITIKNNIFTIECKYNDLLKSKYSDEERRLLWSFKYLNTPIESMSLREKALIQTYVEETEIKPTVYSEFLSVGATEKENVDSKVNSGIGSFIQQDDTDEEQYKFEQEDETEDEQTIKNRILKY